MKRITTGIACLVFLSQLAFSQSIYSFEGFGSLATQGTPYNFSMGGLGIGTPTPWNINTQNPAFTIYNTLSTFQVGLELDRRKFSGENISGTDTEGGMRFLAYAFPVIKGKWSSSFGIVPYSSVNYNTFSEGNVVGSPDNAAQVSDNRGEGGLTNLYWSNGFKIKGKFMVGIRANYTFGAITKASTISIGGTEAGVSSVNYEDFQTYRDFNVQIGLGYVYQLPKERLLNLGFTYSPSSAMQGERELSLIRLSQTGREIQTLPVGANSLSAKLPNVVGFGFSLEKLSVYKVGLDFEYQGWDGAGVASESYNNSFKVVVGGEWIPEFDDVNSYFKRVRYSLGTSYQRLPYIVNDQALVDFGINFGATLPVSGFSSLDLGFRWGQLGKSSDGLIKETYYKIVIGATVNDRWFIKRKYD